MAANLDIILRAQNQASGALRAVKSDLAALERTSGAAGRGFGGLKSIMGVGLLGAATTAGAGIAALGAGLGAATVDGFRINTSLENVRAQLVAFTKDGAKADQMLADIRTEAAKTPFAFEELASATASLLPASIQSGVALEDLIKQAEILAASNPAQGLEGAAFSLREALSGDFVSIIDRFNLPRARLNELKAEGVPAMEAITIAMREMGLDASLVSGMALTMTGRWSTFKDTMDTIKATLAQPLFDKVKTALSDIQPLLDESMPVFQELAGRIGEKMAGAFEKISDSVYSGVYFLSQFAAALSDGQSVLDSFQSALWETFDDSSWTAGVSDAVAGLSAFASQVRAMIAPVLSAVGSFVSWKDALIAVGLVAASVVIPALAGIVTAALPVIAVGAALVAGVALVRNAWERDWGGIQGKAAAAIATVTGWLSSLRGWLAERLPSWIETARGAFDALSSWLQSSAPGWVDGVIRAWGQLQKFITSTIQNARLLFRVIQGLFEGDHFAVEVAVQKFGDFGFALTRLVPIVQNWAEKVRNFVSGAIDAVGPMFDTLLGWIEAARGGDFTPLLTGLGSAFNSALTGISTAIQSFAWADWIDGVLAWGSYVGALAWDAFVGALDWAAGWVTSLDWAGFVSTLSDWAAYVGAVDWAAHIAALADWGAYVSALAWEGIVSTLSDWGTWITSLDWSGFVASLPGWAEYIKALAWESFVSVLSWGAEYVTPLDWSGFVSTLSDWGQWIASLDWTSIITTGIDWAMWIPAMVWNNFVKLLDWATIVAAFAWTEYISKLEWSDVVEFFNGWGEKVGEVDWSERIAKFTDWASYIAEFAWSSFVEKLEWPLIAQFNWSEWIRSFSWPTLPSFSWSSWISSFSWPSLPSFSWRDWIPSFNWPSIPSFPGWSALMDGFFGGGSNDSNDGGSGAAGIPFARGGLTLVGERGPELVMLPRGSRVHNAEDTARMTGQTISVTVNATVASDIDAESLAYRIASIIQRRQRAGAYA